MGLFETLNWVREHGVMPIRDYGPQAQYEDFSIRKHNGPSTPGVIQIQFHNGHEVQFIKTHVRDHDISNDQFGNIIYIQLLHDDNHIQIIKSSTFVVDFWAD